MIRGTPRRADGRPRCSSKPCIRRCSHEKNRQQYVVSGFSRTLDPMNRFLKTLAIIAVALPFFLPARMFGQAAGAAPAPAGRGQAPGGRGQAPGPGRGGGRGAAAAAMNGDLKVVTTHLRPGYLQKNGVPYSANAVLTEYFNRTTEPNGDSWLILTTTVDDPQYLNMPFVRSTHYKRLPDNFSGWEPEACSAR